MTAAPHWTAYLSALATPVIAVLGSWIAFQQWRTARDKLRLDLFEKRMAVYQSARDALGTLFTIDRLTQEEEMKFLSNISEAKWLFGPEVSDYLEKTLWAKFCDHGAYVGNLDGLDPGPERTELVKGKAELRKWFYEQPKKLEELFMPYLGFTHAKSKLW
jgi:hypothetical protein